MHRLTALLLSSLLLSGCASLQRLAEGALDKPRLRFVQATVTAVDLEGTTVALHFTLENPNDVAFRVAGATWRLEVESAEVAKGDLPGGVALASRATAPFAVTVRLRWTEVARLGELARRQAEVAYLVDGAVRVESPIGELSLPYRHEGRLPVRTPFHTPVRGQLSSQLELEVDRRLDPCRPDVTA